MFYNRSHQSQSFEVLLLIVSHLLHVVSRPKYQAFLTVQIRPEAQKAGIAPSREAIWQYFVTKCANNLHIVLAMSPVGETLKTRCRNFPGLVNNTSIDWFMPWPQQALFAVASKFLEEVTNHKEALFLSFRIA